LFDKEGVAQNAAILKGTVFRGKQLTFITEVAAAAANRPSDISNVVPGEKSWKFLTITKKNRTATKPMVKKPVKKRAPSFSSSSDSSSDDDAPLSKAVPTVASSVQEQEKTKAVDDVPIKAEEPITKKRGGRPKGSKNKKAKLDPAPLVPIPTVDEAPVVEINLAPNVAKPKKAIASPIDKLIVDGTVIDEEDAYWLGQALAENEPEDEADLEEETVPEDHPLYHTSGSWRAEGFKLISKTRKSEYLPQQNKAAVAEHDAAALTSGRTARVTGRRLAHDIDATRKATTAQTSETDTFAFNQLRTRKKQLKFSRSPIEGYGLYAMETIAPGEMVCEYVGEIVRSAIAEVREQRYLKQGIGSSYLFRIDGDVVCDATFRGSVRLVSSFQLKTCAHL
jgi:histone-lysine N-methyltransferase SETD1